MSTTGITESVYVVLVETGLFLVGGAGVLLMHCDVQCAVYDDVGAECMTAGPLCFAVLYGAGLAALGGAFAIFAMAVAANALVPGQYSHAVEGMALAALHWVLSVTALIVWTILVAWQQPLHGRRALFAVLMRTGVAYAENEYLTKTYAMAVFVYLGFMVAFAVVMYVGISRAGNITESMRVHSLAATTLLPSLGETLYTFCAESGGQGVVGFQTPVMYPTN